MSHMPPALPVRPARQVLLERLMDAGTWVSPHELTDGISTCRPAVEDAVADLVIEGKAEYREHVGYRLAGSVLQRRAAMLFRENRNSQARRRTGVYGEARGREFRIAVVEERCTAVTDPVMYELSVPLPEDPTESLQTQERAVQALLDKFNTEEMN